MHQQVDAIQMGNHNICLCEEVDKKYIGCNMKTMELFDCALIEMCAINRSNTVCFLWRNKIYYNHFWLKKKTFYLELCTDN